MGIALRLALSTLLGICAASDTSQMCCRGNLSAASLGLSPGTQVYQQSNPAFAGETERWTAYHAPTFVFAVKPVIESDVQKLVRYAAACSIPFLGQGGSHGFTTTLGNLNNGLLIDLGNFRSVSVNAIANTVTVGGGTIFADLFEPLYAAGKEITTGTSSCVGMLGATLGGGVGRYNGLHGMILDALISVRIVTASGHVVVASTTHNADLFWAVRGAGFNYGIVTEATYQVSDLTSSLVANGDFAFPANASSALMEYITSFGEDIPAKLALILLARYDAKFGGLLFWLNAVHPGPKSELMALLSPLLTVAAPVAQNVSVVPWKDLTKVAFFAAEAAPNVCDIKGLNASVYGAAIETWDIPTFETFYADLATFYETYPGAQNSVFFIEYFSKKKMLTIPDDATAYPLRNITAHLLWNFADSDSALDGPVNVFAKSAQALFQATSGLPSPEVYVSYAHGDETPEVLYGARKLPKLRAIKKEWDPDNLFGFYNPLV